ncbi:sensor histidine kinase [Streptomyces sp. SP17KL33]|uniref:sensor histidine kinase n=1 Tax=Streptomyces sp. SP17KL33 TaxID=3002534 RepID=UPI002E768576|nr:sensor histidine kinase [Streptomyces sp. SP17KL33]MEE1831777.1 sensor histidine kinase [Streptomyces sp. SP17KL33]
MATLGMSDRRTSTATGSAPSRPVPWVAPLLYLAVLLAGLTAAAHNDALFTPRTTGFVVGLLLLLLLERKPLWSWPPVALLAVRLCLIVAVAALDESGLSRALLVLVPFTAYFAFGRTVALALAACCVAVVLGLYALSEPTWYVDPEYVSDLLMLLIGLVLALSMAAVAIGEQRGRARLEEYAARVAELSATNERNRLARDIHDSLGHHLTAIAVQLEKADAFRDHDPAAADQAVADARRSAGLALDDVRTSVRALRDDHRGGPPLPSALAELVRQLDDSEVRASLAVQGEAYARRYSQPSLTALYRAAQEALTNVRRHAGARRVTVSLALGADRARLVVTDDGRGFGPGVADQGFGLTGIQERARLLGGTVGVDSAPGAGTRITVEIPSDVPETGAGT